MKLHTDKLTWGDVDQALARAKDANNVTADVRMVTKSAEGSRSRRYGYEIQLGTYDKTSGPGKSRRHKNSGNAGASTFYAATYDEWGWFLAEIFAADEDAIFGKYLSAADFHYKTQGDYVL